MDLEQIKELISALEKSSLQKISVKREGFELRLEKEGTNSVVSRASFLPPHYQPTFVHPPEQQSLVEFDPKPQRSENAPPAVDTSKCISSPMVGTFYAAPAPDQPSFVKVGDYVEEGTIVCVIEAMKVMNEVKAGMSGTITEILVKNAEPVEFGTKIFCIS